MKNDQDHAGEKTGFGRGVTRRKFLKTIGSGAAIAAASEALTGRIAAQAEVIRSEEMVRVNLSINGIRRSLVVESRWSLLYVLREKLGLTGIKVGCERAGICVTPSRAKTPTIASSAATTVSSYITLIRHRPWSPCRQVL